MSTSRREVLKGLLAAAVGGPAAVEALVIGLDGETKATTTIDDFDWKQIEVGQYLNIDGESYVVTSCTWEASTVTIEAQSKDSYTVSRPKTSREKAYARAFADRWSTSVEPLTEDYLNVTRRTGVRKTARIVVET